MEVDSTREQLNQASLNIIPHIAIIETILNKIHPDFPFKTIRQKGV